MGESTPIKAGRPEAMPHLATACKGINTIWETKEIFSEVWEKSAAVDSAVPNSKGILLCLCQHFVNARFFSTPDFCRCENFVGARILLSREFFRCENFVDANNFRRCQYFVATNILTAPIFCIPWNDLYCYFYIYAKTIKNIITVHILSPPIFLIIFRLRMII
jgi:hypothetical protein